jgi:hypothetical protein
LSIWFVTSDLLDDGCQKYAIHTVSIKTQTTFFRLNDLGAGKLWRRKACITDDSCKHKENLSGAKMWREVKIQDSKQKRILADITCFS